MASEYDILLPASWQAPSSFCPIICLTEQKAIEDEYIQWFVQAGFGEEKHLRLVSSQIEPFVSVLRLYPNANLDDPITRELLCTTMKMWFFMFLVDDVVEEAPPSVAQQAVDYIESMEAAEYASFPNVCTTQEAWRKRYPMSNTHPRLYSWAMGLIMVVNMYADILLRAGHSCQDVKRWRSMQYASLALAAKATVHEARENSMGLEEYFKWRPLAGCSMPLVLVLDAIHGLCVTKIPRQFNPAELLWKTAMVILLVNDGISHFKETEQICLNIVKVFLRKNVKTPAACYKKTYQIANVFISQIHTCILQFTKMAGLQDENVKMMLENLIYFITGFLEYHLHVNRYQKSPARFSLTFVDADRYEKISQKYIEENKEYIDLFHQIVLGANCDHKAIFDL